MSPNWLDPERIRQVAESFAWRGDRGNFTWADEPQLTAVGRYLVHYGTVGYWRAVLEGALRGYSLFLHEHVELAKYQELGADPFCDDQQRRYYRQTHPWGLLLEHRLLRAAAWSEGRHFSLRELVENNPHGDPPEDGFKGDWHLLSSQLPEQLTREDGKLDPARLDAVRDFYRRHGFHGFKELSRDV